MQTGIFQHPAIGGRQVTSAKQTGKGGEGRKGEGESGRRRERRGKRPHEVYLGEEAHQHEPEAGYSIPVVRYNANNLHCAHDRSGFLSTVATRYVERIVHRDQQDSDHDHQVLCASGRRTQIPSTGASCDRTPRLDSPGSRNVIASQQTLYKHHFILI